MHQNIISSFQAAEGERNGAKNLICSVDKTMILSMFYLVSPSFQVAFCCGRIQTQIKCINDQTRESYELNSKSESEA